MHPHAHHYGAAPIPAPGQEEPLGHYLSVTYAELLKAHVLDVHLPNILIGISASIEIPLVTILGRRIGASYSSIADYISVMALCRTLLDIPFGIAVEYVGVRNVMFLCLFLNIVASLIGLNVSNSASLLAFCILSGISLGGFFLARHIFVAGITSKKYRGLLMAILSGLLRWAHVIGPVASGIFASYLGDVRYSFVVPAVASGIAFGSLAIATQSTRCQQVCERTCRASLVSSVARTPLHSEQEEDASDIVWHHPGGTDRDDAYVVTALLPPATAPFPTKSGGTSSLPDSASHRVIANVERSGNTSPSLTHHPHHAHANGGVATRPRSCSVASTASASLHPDTGASQEHNFHLTTLWCTFVDYWSVIWRLGLYIVLVTALRANRKLLISFAGLRAAMTDAQVSYLMGFSFIFDAILFPLGGLMMDLLGRQFAMVPTAVGLGIVFTLLPLCTTELKLYMAASAFGIVDALGCGIIMTLTADRAPPYCGAPFFGIMRTVQDMGHVVGARGVSSLMRYAGFDVCCWMLTVVGFFTAAWGVYGVPSDTEVLPEAPRLEQAAIVAHERRLHKLSLYSRSSEETAPLTVVSATATPPTMTYGTATRPQPAPCVRQQQSWKGYRSVARS
ncbi:putative drug resistence protein [Leishmania mexicana MHOM/GT/2001/U1103]|uniref:Integral membrane transport protein n=1 Tax=Leishmania mexicana (strain MHOM/GT/2001/U1103) TaxID=929439 RepID=E9AMM6_LEIMU|nr:putative drug resistence protein [Leishmania mexicana MHOM/GT/2001/U1103]CBZ24181.1 putative drug resistence protein [Leishmania mexicana MHOM/GT/2001/U1103]